MNRREQVSIGLVASAAGAAAAFGAPATLAFPALGALPIAAAIAFRWPILLAVLFVLFSFFRIHEVFPFLMPFKLPLVLAAATLFSVFWNIAFHRLQPYWDPVLGLFLAFFLLVTLGIAFSSDPGNSFAYWKDTYVKIAVMTFAIAWLVRTERDFSLVVHSILFASIAVAIVALKNKAAGIDLVEGSRVTIGREIGSILGDPNDLSLVLLFGAGFAIANCLTKHVPWHERLLGGIAYALIVGGIVATQSRGGLLGIAAVTGVVAAQRIRSKLLIAVVGAIALVVLFIAAGVSDRQSGGAGEEGVDESAMGRIHAWKAAFQMALHNPVTGVGLDNFYSNYFEFSDFWDGKNHAVHSTWFGVLGEAGLVGLVLFVWMIWAIFSSLRKSGNILATDNPAASKMQKTVNGMLGGTVGFVVSGTFLTQGFTWPIYIILGLTVALTRYTSAIPLKTHFATNKPSQIANAADENRITH